MLVTTDEHVDYEEFAKVLAEKLINIKETKWVVKTWTRPLEFKNDYRELEFDTYAEADKFANNFKALDKKYFAVVTTVRRGELK